MGSFQETRLNLEPSSSTFSVDVKLPSNAPAPRTRRSDTTKTASDGHDFRSRGCATASSVYRRKHHKYPASFLWRVLDDDTVLSVQSVDVVKPIKAADANLVLNFHFPNPIRPTCIALADPADHDALTIFVLDTANQLYTLFLRPDSFRKRSFVETGLGDVCKVHTPNSLKNFKSVYRLLAVNSDQLIAALYDGGLIRFDRELGHNATRTPWKETFYNSKGWGLKNLLPHRGDIDMTAAAASVHTNLGYHDASFLLSVCIDHRLRAWNLNSGQILKTLDLLNNNERNPQETGKWQIEKSQTNLIRVIGDTEGTRLCVTYSPVGCGEFKFWKLESDDTNSLRISDALEGIKLVPRPPYVNDVWTLADFAIAQSPVKGRRAGVTMSLLWKNNMAYRVQQLSFVLPERGYDYTDLKQAWNSEWPLVHANETTPVAEESGPSDPSDVTEKWLKTILAPGRFPKSTIEAAVGHYERATGVSRGASSRKNLGLAEAMCNAVVVKSSTSQTHEQFRTATERQWRKFYRILLELDKPRGEALGLAYDVELTDSGADSGVPWVICADRISVIRPSSELEALCQRASNPDSPLCALLATGKEFIDGFSDGMQQICKSVLRAELFEETTKMDSERIQFFSDKAGFWRQISDEDCNQVTETLGANFELVTDQLYAAVLEKCNQTPADRPQLPVTDFGRNIVLRTAQDIAEQQWDICFSQLILLVHMEFEFDRPEDALHNRVDIGSVYRHLLNALHRLELIRWLGTTQVTLPLSKSERTNATTGDSPAATKQRGPDSKIVTALEASIGHLLGFDSTQLLPTSISNAAANLCAPGSDIVLPPEHIQCYLLLQQRPDLALDLAPFCDQSPFSTYVQGRVFLALQDFQEAATCFKKAAYGMGVRKNKKPKDSSGLLDDTEWNLLYEDQPRYYAHIVALFEKLKAYSYVVDFARLSLQLINSRSTVDASALRMEIQSRLFQGALLTSRFELAHATLVSMTDHAVQKNCLGKLVSKMCDELHTAELVSLSFPSLQNDVDDILASRCREATDVVTGPPYHQILYAWRIRRNDYRGAAKVLMERIEKLRASGDDSVMTGGAQGQGGEGTDVLDTAVTRQYLMLINVLSCVEPKQAWITAEGGATGKRRVVTLADIRKEYQDELDRIAAIENNQFGFTAGDEMEIL